MQELPTYLDVSCVQDLHALLVKQENPPSYELMMKDVTRIHTLPVQILVAAQRTFRERGGALRLVQPSTAIREAFMTLGLQSCWREMTDEQEGTYG